MPPPYASLPICEMTVGVPLANVPLVATALELLELGLRPLPNRVIDFFVHANAPEAQKLLTRIFTVRSAATSSFTMVIFRSFNSLTIRL